MKFLLIKNTVRIHGIKISYKKILRGGKVMRKLLCIIVACLMIMAIFSGCGLFKKAGLMEDENDELRPASSIVMNEEQAVSLNDKVPIRLYFANDDNTKLVLEVRYIPISEAKKSVNNLAAIIVNELISGSKEGRKATIPEGTKLLSPVKIEAGVATVNFSKEFRDNHPGGKAAEQITIFSVVNSLTELKEIQKVKFLIDGKEEKEYKGSFRFNTPFERSDSLISKEPQKTGATGSSTETFNEDQESLPDDQETFSEDDDIFIDDQETFMEDEEDLYDDLETHSDEWLEDEILE